jgi:hypothetical protein
MEDEITVDIDICGMLKLLGEWAEYLEGVLLQ